MENKKKLLLQVLFLLVVFAGTIYGAFHGEDLGKILNIISTVSPLYLLLVVACVVSFIWESSQMYCAS